VVQQYGGGQDMIDHGEFGINDKLLMLVLPDDLGEVDADMVWISVISILVLLLWSC
jgi:hypothetical protein